MGGTMDRHPLRLVRNGADRLANYEINGRNWSFGGFRCGRSTQVTLRLVFLGIICLLPAICRSEDEMPFFNNIDSVGETKVEEEQNSNATRHKGDTVAEVFERVLDKVFPDKDPQEDVLGVIRFGCSKWKIGIKMTSTLFLHCQDVLNFELHGSPMKQVLLERLEGIKREFQELDTVWFMAGSLFKQYPLDIPTEAFSFEIFKQAFVAVQSCFVHLQGVSLARRFVWCRPQPNTRLLLNCGFVDEDNPYDRLSVEASLETKGIFLDTLYQEKRILVQKRKLSTIQNFQFYKGKEKGAVLEMLPYIRLGHVADPADMECVGFAEGPICQLNPCNERAVLDQLAGYFTRRLAGYRTSLVEDIAVIQDEKADPKKLVATQLLRIEKEILGNALSEVNELINELPDGTVAPCSGSYVPKLK